MFLYRVIEKEKYINGKFINKVWDGVNTFNYDNNEEYLHFFLLPESAEIYQRLKYTNNDIESVVIKCDIPYSMIKNNFGVGMYRWYYPRTRSSFLEVRLNKKDFDNSMVIEVSDNVEECWKNKAIYSRYINKIINTRNINRDRPVKITLDNNGAIEKVELNEEFNFLNYVPLDQLGMENLENDYNEDIVIEEDYNNRKIEKTNKSFLDKLKSLFNKKSR